MPQNQTVEQYAANRIREQLLGFPIRGNLFPGEKEFFKQNTNVTGMAAEDNSIILNPFSNISPREKMAVARNEALRLRMREDEFVPKFEVTDEQRKAFEGTAYEGNDDFLKQTIAARIFSGDPSAMATGEQRKEVQQYLSEIQGNNKTAKKKPKTSR